MRQPTILLLLCFALLCATTSPEPHPAAAFRPGKDHAILFAVNTYKAPLTTLSNPITNARQIATELESRFGFKPQVVENPSAAQIETILRDYTNRFARNLNGEYPSSGQLFIFFSGHGTEQLENGFFLPADADMNNLRQTGLQYNYLRPLINAINCQHILVAVDACYSVTFDEDYKKKPDFEFRRPGELSENDKILANHNQYKARVFFTSDAVGDMTPDKSNFAKKLLEGLRTFNPQSGFMTSSELFANYVQKASPTPHGGEFGADEAGSTFLFFSALPKPVVDPAADVRAWNEAKTANTLEAYRAYLRNFAQGEFRELAESRVKVFEQKNTDYANWQKAKLANTRQALEQYLRENPNGDYRDLAEAALQRLNAVANTPLDTDKDGVPDATDQCPNQFGPTSNNGCPVPSSESSYDDPYIGRMVLVKGGIFQMGDANGESDEKPVHSVSLNNFYMGKTEVTQAQWQAIMGSNPSSFKNCDQCPVESVSWNDVQEFIKKLNAKTGKTYRLPTEAEWEYAARGGKSSTYTYAGSNTVDEVAWYSSNSGSKTHPVGEKKANELGLYDMSGNVWEWCQDWYADDYYAKSPSSNPPGPTTGSGRVCRGGSWYYYPAVLRVALRYGYAPSFRNYSIGFRLARQQ